MKTRSAKAKGRSLQIWVRDKILEYFPDLTRRDVQSTTMGDQGTDIKLSEKAYGLIPYDIECKNVEKVNVWQAYKQAHVRDGGEPLVVIKKNYHKPLVVIDAEHFIKILGELNEADTPSSDSTITGIGGVTD